MTIGYVAPAGTTERRWLGTTFTDFLATGEQTDGAFALVDEVAQKGESVPLHTHEGDVESFYVVDGEVTFFIGEAAGIRVTAGAFAHVPAGTVHGFRVESESARYLILTTPRHADFYRAITLPSREGNLPPLEAIDSSVIGKACDDYGIELVGPLPDPGP